VQNVAADIAVDGQYEPMGQMVATLLFEGQYVVALHVNCVAEDEPAGQAYPPLHSPDTALKPELLQ
jgi:hypothetical protein